MIHVHSCTQRESDEWMREQGLRPRDCRTYGNLSWKSMAGTRYRSTDRIVILGEVNALIEVMIQVGLRKAPEPKPVIERHELLPLPR